ncbi:MAG TPA: hypothetical protein VK031_08855 [Tissierellaceae bacterium]|nr:hypothetical protein [Tissierellaceae bacterium]
MSEQIGKYYTDNNGYVRWELERLGFNHLPIPVTGEYLYSFISRHANSSEEWIEKNYVLFNKEDKKEIVTQYLPNEEYLIRIACL